MDKKIYQMLKIKKLFQEIQLHSQLILKIFLKIQIHLLINNRKIKENCYRNKIQKLIYLKVKLIIIKQTKKKKNYC